MMNKVALYTMAIATFGRENQLNMAMEECAELIQSINKVLRENQTRGFIDSNVVMDMFKELADVEIMIEQIKLMYHISDDMFGIIKDNKLYRLKSKLDDI